MSVYAVPVEGNPVWTEIAMLDYVAAKAHAGCQFDCGAVALTCVVIGDDSRYMMLQDRRFDESLIVRIALRKRNSMMRWR
jgi:hypothetical protein